MNGTNNLTSRQTPIQRRDARAPSAPGEGPPRPRPAEAILRSEALTVERKKFIVSRRQNIRGEFLKITEEGGGHRNSIILPLEGYRQFMVALEDVLL